MASRVIEHGTPTGDGREAAEAGEAQRTPCVDRAVASRYE